MTLFTSKRERRLWVWTALVVATIYSTLRLAGILADFLRENGLLSVSFACAALLVLVAAVTRGLTSRPGWTEVAVALGIAAVYLLVVVRLGIPAAERTHLVEYGVVAMLLHEALEERARNGRSVAAPALIAVVATAGLGLIDEGIQAILPSRVFDWVDVLFNSLAAVMAVGASVSLSWARRRARAELGHDE